MFILAIDTALITALPPLDTNTVRTAQETVL